MQYAVAVDARRDRHARSIRVRRTNRNKQSSIARGKASQHVSGPQSRPVCRRTGVYAYDVWLHGRPGEHDMCSGVDTLRRLKHGRRDQQQPKRGQPDRDERTQSCHKRRTLLKKAVKNDALPPEVHAGL